MEFEGRYSLHWLTDNEPPASIRFCFVALVEKQSVDPRFAIGRRVGLGPTTDKP